MKWGMFSAKGVAAIDDIISRAYSVEDAIQRCELLAAEGIHKEANDTAVREAVWQHYNLAVRQKPKSLCEVFTEGSAKQYLSAIGSRGGAAGRGKAKARTSAQARKAAMARWSKQKLRACNSDEQKAKGQ